MTSQIIEPLAPEDIDETLPSLDGGPVESEYGSRNPFGEDSSTFTVDGPVSHAQLRDEIKDAAGLEYLLIETSFIDGSSTVHVSPKVDEKVLAKVVKAYSIDEQYGKPAHLAAYDLAVAKLRSGEDLDLVEINNVLRALVGI